MKACAGGLAGVAMCVFKPSVYGRAARRHNKWYIFRRGVRRAYSDGVLLCASCQRSLPLPNSNYGF